MNLIFAAADKGEFLTPKQIHERLSYGPSVTYPAIICTIRILRDDHGLIESVYDDERTDKKIRRGCRSYVKPTIKAYRTLR